MKKIIKLFFIFVLTLFCYYNNFYGGIIYNTYYIVFDKNPQDINNDISFKGFKIGKIISKDLSNEGNVIIKIWINNKYKNFLKTSTVFYVNNDKTLELEILDKKSEIAPENYKFLGFTKKYFLELYKIKLKTKNISKELLKKTNELLKNFKNKLNQSDGKENL